MECRYVYIAMCSALVRVPSYTYRKISNIRREKTENLGDCRLVLQLPLANPLTVPTGDAPTTTEWSTMLLPTRVALV